MAKMRIVKWFWGAIIFCPFTMVSCTKNMPGKESVIENGQKLFNPVESIVFELNGEKYISGTMDKKNDTITLQEEGLRVFKIAGYKPEDAYPVPTITGINFYQDIYAFNYTKDSIVILSGKYATPVNHYLSFIEGNFQQLTGANLAKAMTIRFYNMVNRTHDMSVIEIDGIMQQVKWESLGKLRRYRIELNITQQEGETSKEQTFSIPFYEQTNKVEISGFPDTSTPYIILSPGDSLQLVFRSVAPEEFTIYEWAKGVANKRFDSLNREHIEQLYLSDLNNPLLTEEARRYTDSKVSLSRNGMLKVDKSWDAGQATSNGGHIYNEVPVCIIMMPQLNSQDITTANTPTPFFCNGLVKINTKR